MIKQIDSTNIDEINKRIKRTYKNKQKEQIALDISEAMKNDVHFFELENEIYDYKNIYQKIVEQMQITIKGKIEKIVRDTKFEHENIKEIIEVILEYCYDVATRYVKEDDRRHAYVKWNTENVVNILESINQNNIDKTLQTIYNNYKKCYLNSNYASNLDAININEYGIVGSLIKIFGYKEIYKHYINKANIFIDRKNNISYSEYMSIPYDEHKWDRYTEIIEPNIQIYLDDVIDENTIVVKGDWGKAKVKIETALSYTYEDIIEYINNNKEPLINLHDLFGSIENDEIYDVEIWKDTEIYNKISKYLDNKNK